MGWVVLAKVRLVDPLPWEWLVLFIEALVLFPNIEREGIPQWRDLKGDN